MPAYLAKPVSPRWQPGQAPAGCKLYMPLAEGAGRTVRDYATGYRGSFVGSPTWGRGPYGAHLGGFTATDYPAIDPPAQLLESVYPCWMASLATNTATTQTYSLAQGNSADNSPIAAIAYNFNAPGTLAYFLRDNLGTETIPQVSVPQLTDGLPHVVMCVSFSKSDHRVYLDGVQVATNSGTTGTLTLDTLTIGALRRTSVIGPFAGSILWVGCGNRSVPDPLALAQDLLSGAFSAVRPRSPLALWAAAMGGPGPITYSPAALMMGF